MASSSLLQQLDRGRAIVPALIIFLLGYLVWGTGIHSDDYPFILQLQTASLRDVLFPAAATMTVLIFGPGSYYFDFLQYWGFGAESLASYDLIKWLVLMLGVWFTYRFASDYLPPDRALLAALLFFLYPIHDATVYWTATLVYALTPAVIMYSHYLIRRERYMAGVTMGMLGSFTTYASPPYTFGLGLIFLAQRAYKKAFFFMAPGVVYVGYYFIVSRLPGASKGRINPDLTPQVFIKQYLVQVGSFIDAALGPSFWLKVWYSASSVTLLSLAVLMIVMLAFWRWFKAEKVSVHKPLLLGLLGVLLLSFAMFALTGYYPQMAFNLGNRVMVYGALLLALGVAMLPLGRVAYSVVVAVMLLAVLGLSDHWKAWNVQQKQIIAAIGSNSQIRQLQQNDVLLVAGNAYSKLGPFSHIEFSSETYMASSLVRYALAGEPVFRVRPITRRHQVQGAELVDRKYGERTPLPAVVAIYDTERNTVTMVPIAALNNYFASLPPDVRHWVQLLEPGWLRDTLLSLMPRLRYLFEP